MYIWLLIVLLLLLANLPWFGHRLFLIVPMQFKPIWVRLIELAVYYLLGLLIATGFEWRYAGNVYQQDWEFFVTTLSLFLVLAVPGVIYRYQWLPMQKKYR